MRSRPIIVCSVLLVAAPHASGVEPACDPGNAGLHLPEGFCALVVEVGVDGARRVGAPHEMALRDQYLDYAPYGLLLPHHALPGRDGAVYLYVDIGEAWRSSTDATIAGPYRRYSAQTRDGLIGVSNTENARVYVVEQERGYVYASADDEERDPVALPRFPAQWTPYDVLLYTGDQFPARYRGGAFLALHGAWSRQRSEREEDRVVFAPFVDDEAAGTYESFADGFAPAGALRTPADARFPAMGLAVGADGSLYITDSLRGLTWRVLYRD